MFAPDDGPGKQLRNVGSGNCAWIENGDYSNGHRLEALGCAGRRDQLWTHPASGSGPFGALNSTKCLTFSGGAAVVSECNNSNGQKWDIDGLAIKNSAGQCLADAGDKPGSDIVVQGCNGSANQQWLFGPPPTIVPDPDIRLTALDSGGTPTGDCADLDVALGEQAIAGPRWTQTFPCLGESRTTQNWNMSPDGRIVDRQNPGNCLGFDKKIVAVEACAQGGGQLWVYEGTQIRNIRTDTCVTGFGGRRWLELTACTNGAGQAWSLDPATSPSLGTIVQLRNNKHADCMEPDGAVTQGRWVWTFECGGLDRAGQAFIQLTTDELVSLDNPAMCLTSRGLNNAVDVEECARLGYANTTPNNPSQRWTTSASSQLQLSGTNNCAQGNGNLQYATLVACATSGDVSAQQWSPEELGTATSPLRQMRNLDSNSCGDLRDGVNAIAWPCSGPDRAIQGVLLAKVGSEYELRSAANPNQCLDVQSGGADNAAVRPIRCNYSTYQRWTLSANGQLTTQSPQGRCLQGGLDNAPLAMKTCTTSNAQRWAFETPNDTRQLRQIRNVESQSCLDVVGSPNQGDQFTGFPCVEDGRPNQVFVQLNNGAFSAAASDTNLCVDAGNSNGAPVLLWGCKNPAQSHQWLAQNTKFVQVAFGRCAEFNPISNGTDTRNCADPKPYQAWAVEAVGSTAGSPAIQFRSGNTATDRLTACLDIDGMTRSEYGDNDKVMVLPCLGTGRTNQSFRLMSNGIIRSTGTPTQCLDAASGANVKRPVLYACDANKDDQRWKLDAGRIMNVTKAGVTRGKCIQGGPDGVQARMENCSTSADQQWVNEALGSNVRAEAVGRLRTPQADLCLETKAPQDWYEKSVWSWPCAASGRAQQRFVRLNTGQYRPVGNPGFCLDANGGTDGAIPATKACIEPTLPAGAPQRWNIDPARGWLSSSNSTLCVEATGGGLGARQRPCSTDSAGNPSNANRLWVFVPEAGL